MNEKLKFVIELINRVTAPARAITESMRSITSAADNMRQHASAAGGSVQNLGGSMASLSKGVAVGQLAASAISSIARGAWEASKAFAGAALEAASFKENTLVGLGVMLKSETKAKEVYAQAQEFAAATPFNTQQVLKLYQDLIGAGFSIEKNTKGISEVSALAETIGNAAAIRGLDPEALSGITRAISQIKGKGKLSIEELNQMSERGVNSQLVFDQLAKIYNKKVEEIPKLIATGTVDAQTAINAIVAGIGTNFGGMMKEQSKTLTGVWSTLQSRPMEILAELADTGAFQTLKEFVGALAELLSPSGAAAVGIKDFMKNSIEWFFNKVFGWAKDAEGKITPASLQAGFKKLSGFFLSIYERIKPVISALGRLWETLSAAFTSFQQGGPWVDVLTFAFDTLVAAVVAVIEGFRLLSTVGQYWNSLVMTVVAAVLSIGESLTGSWQQFWDLAYKLGEAIWKGLKEGIVSGKGSVKEAVLDFVGTGGVYGVAARYLKVRSPSKLFEELGQYTALGFAGGLDNGANAVNAAALAMIAPPNFTAAGAAFASAYGGTNGGLQASGKGTITIQNLSVVVQGEPGASTEENIKQGALAALSEAFEEMGWEMGIAPQ